VKTTHDVEDVDIHINTLDAKGRGIDGIYLTVTGTSADGADCGQVGRGNRVNGIIPLNRPIGSEAAAGKNPVSHVGKIYNVLTHKIANRVYENVDGVDEVYIWLLSQIGKPIDHPAVAAAQVSIKQGGPSVDSLEKQIHEEIDAELADIKKFTMELARGEHSVC
jgi:S-adenosylmethionine synthetase